MERSTEKYIHIPFQDTSEKNLTEEQKSPDDQKLPLPSFVDLIIKSDINRSCITIDCDNIKKLIDILKEQIYDQDLIKHIRSFIDNILQLNICLKNIYDTLKDTYLKNKSDIKEKGLTKKLELTPYIIRTLTCDFTNIESLFNTLSQELYRYNKLNKSNEHKIKAKILNYNFYSVLKKYYNLIASLKTKQTYITHIFTRITIKSDTVENSYVDLVNMVKINFLISKYTEICNFNTEVLKKIYKDINELILSNSKKEIVVTNINIHIPNKKENELALQSSITKINLKKKTFTYADPNNMLFRLSSSRFSNSTSKFTKLCISDTNCLDVVNNTPTAKAELQPCIQPDKVDKQYTSSTLASSLQSSSSINDDGVVAGLQFLSFILNLLGNL